MELDCSDKKIYRLIFDRQEITSGVTHRAHRSLWAHFKVNPKVITETELWCAVYQIPENRIKIGLIYLTMFGAKKKPSPGGNPREGNKRKNKYIFIVTRKRAFVNV